MDVCSRSRARVGKTRMRNCVGDDGRAVKGREAPRAFDEYRCRVQTGLVSANLVIAPTRAMLAELQTIYGFFGDSAVIPNGRNGELFYGAPKEERILTAGRIWDAAKN